MEEQAAQDPNANTSANTNSSSSGSGSPSRGSATADQRTEPVRSRWTPKPEQILILESIFNSGMVNPPKDETVRIRKLLEKFGTVGDANVFYWFQNRRSRSRRRQRQLQAASLAAAATPPPPPPLPQTTITTTAIANIGGAPIYHAAQGCTGLINSGFIHQDSPPPPCVLDPCGGSFIGASSSSSCGNDSFFGQISMPGMEHGSDVCPSDASNLDYQSPGIITVFINGVATQVPGGQFDMKAMFGEDVMLVHHSGLPVPINDFGISLQPGESYFLDGSDHDRSTNSRS
ncbi:wuschel- homeobox [Ancistrocladus abbreviatus]